MFVFNISGEDGAIRKDLATANYPLLVLTNLRLLSSQEIS